MSTGWGVSPVTRKQLWPVSLVILPILGASLILVRTLHPEEKPLPLVAVLLSDDVRQPKVDGLRAGLASRGYREGENVRITVISTKGNREELPAAAASLLRLNPAVAVAAGSIEAITLKAASGPRVPIVMMGLASSVESGLVGSIRHPGGNITGVDNGHAELTAKRLELLVTLLPQIKRVIALYDPSVMPSRHGLRVALDAGASLGLTLIPVAIVNRQDLLEKLEALQPKAADAILLLSTGIIEASAREIHDASIRTGIPVMGVNENDVGAGIFAAYGSSYETQGRQSARFVAKLLQGQNAGDLPVETPDSPELVVNLGIARRLGLHPSPVGLAFARILDVPWPEGSGTAPEGGRP